MQQELKKLQNDGWRSCQEIAAVSVK